eukprot:322223_1
MNKSLAMLFAIVLQMIIGDSSVRRLLAPAVCNIVLKDNSSAVLKWDNFEKKGRPRGIFGSGTWKKRYFQLRQITTSSYQGYVLVYFKHNAWWNDKKRAEGCIEINNVKQ